MTLTQINRAGLDADALDRVFTIGASGSSAYTFQGEGLNGTVNNPTLYLTRGKTYRFENGSGGHPIRIQSTSGASGTAYNTGVTNNAGSGTVIVEVQHDAPDVLYYQCTSHAAMNGILYITGALADGGVTTAKLATSAVTNAKLAADAVTNSKIADDSIDSEHYVDGSIDAAHIASGAVTNAKIGSDAVTNTKIQDNAITTAKIQDSNITTAKLADQAVTLAKLPHGTSSNDGKFLRANNGADPTFETVSGTTINNNANNRLITGSGTANTLEAETNIIFDGTNLDSGATSDSSVKTGTFRVNHYTHSATNPINVIGCSSGSGYNNVQIGGSDTSFTGTAATGIRFYTAGNATTANGTLRGYFDTGGNLGISDGNLVIGTSGHGIDFSASGGPSGSGNELLDDYEEGTWTPTFGGQLTGQSYDQQVGQYTKIGNFVIATCQVKLAGDPGSYASNVHINGLPFNGKSGGIGGAAVLAYQTNFNSATDGRGNFTGMVNPNQASIRFYTPDGTYYLWSEVNDRDEQVRVTATYRTN